MLVLTWKASSSTKFGKRFFRGCSNLIMAGNGGAVASLIVAYDAGFTTATTNKLAYANFATARNHDQRVGMGLAPVSPSLFPTESLPYNPER